MAANETVRMALLEMGVDPPKALHAAQRYETAEAAINWVFGEGENWVPEDTAWIELPDMKLGFNSPARHPSPVEEPPPPSAPAPAPKSTITLGSNNPFLNPLPAVPDEGRVPTGQDTEESKERERSVRASAPPPDGEEGEVIGTLFGPTNKDDPEGKMSVTVSAPDTSNKEEEEFQRAIRESMMTASFHSDSPQQSLPLPAERQPGGPVVYVTATQPAFVAHLLQAMVAVPQIRDIVAGFGVREFDGPELETLRSLVALQADGPDSFTDSYTLVDNEFATILDRRVIPTGTLPPSDIAKDLLVSDIEFILLNALSQRKGSDLIDMEVDDPSEEGNYAYNDFQRHPSQLLSTLLRSSPEAKRYVTMQRTLSEPSTIHEQLAKVMWAPDTPAESIDQLADVVFVSLARTPGVAAPKWELDSEIILEDRYLTQNVVWATQERAGQGVLQGELRRLKERVDDLTSFKGHSLPDALKTLESELTGSEDEAKIALKAKLERISKALADRVLALKEESAQKEELLKQTSFETDDPERLQHKYRLRAILWHDGFNTPGSHLYAYINHNDHWWRIGETTALNVTWSEVQEDNTGQFTDGGPYFLVYSRQGPRPPPPVVDLVSSSSGSSICEVSVDGSSVEAMDVSPPGGSPPSIIQTESKAALPVESQPASETVATVSETAVESSNLIDLVDTPDEPSNPPTLDHA